MTQLKKRAVWTLLIWSFALVAMFVVFFSGGGPAAFLDGDQKVMLTRLSITVGFSVYFIMLILTRIRAAGSLIKDERDEQIVRRAYMISFHTVLYYIFISGASLYFFYRIHKTQVLMPVGWVWILAISSMCVGFISNAAAMLIIDARMSGHGEN